MKIGVKYCGGCNSQYHRKEEVEKIKRKLSGCTFEPVHIEKKFDYILFVCGCQRACLRGRWASNKKKHRLLTSIKDFENIEKILELEE